MNCKHKKFLPQQHSVREDESRLQEAPVVMIGSDYEQATQDAPSLSVYRDDKRAEDELGAS